MVVVVDDLRWDDVGAYGHPFVHTPHIDRIARQGARFANAFSTTPLCSPSRGSILTGLYPHSNGIIDNTDRSVASHQLMTFAGTLQQAGYETGFIGKWHMGNDPTRRPGFDYWVGMKGQGEAVDPYLCEGETTVKVEGYVTDLLTDRAVDFIRRDREKPFLLLVAHKALHPNLVQHHDGRLSPIGGGGFIPAQRHQDLYADDELPRRPNYGRLPVGKPALQRTIGQLPPLGRGTVTSDEDIRERLRMLMAVDEGLGRMLDSLEEMGVLDDTVIVFTSDHGYFYGEHGLSVERRLAYEEALRIPLLVRYPPLVVSGTTPQPMALTIDLAPTLIELGRTEADQSLHGSSLVPLLQGVSVPWRESFLIEYFSDTVFERVDHMGYQAVRTDRYKYICYTDLQGLDELYDLEADPYEMDNVIDSARYGRILRSLKKELSKLLEEST